MRYICGIDLTKLWCKCIESEYLLKNSIDEIDEIIRNFNLDVMSQTLKKRATRSAPIRRRYH